MGHKGRIYEEMIVLTYGEESGERILDHSEFVKKKPFGGGMVLCMDGRTKTDFVHLPLIQEFCEATAG